MEIQDHKGIWSWKLNYSIAKYIIILHIIPFSFPCVLEGHGTIIDCQSGKCSTGMAGPDVGEKYSRC